MAPQPLEQAGLVSPGGRQIRYLRLSITDLCDLRCRYCMPAEGVVKLHHNEVLRYEEHLEIVRVAAAQGIRKLRITGGEPLVKKGVVHLLRQFAATSGIEELALTTNGQRLAHFAQALKDAGLQRVNVSLDSLHPRSYAEITRGGDPGKTIEGIAAALSVGLKVKLNAVLVPGVNDDQIEPLFAFASGAGVPLRFIERMSFSTDEPFVPEADVLTELGAHHAIEFGLPDLGSAHVRRVLVDGHEVGFISPYSRPFCGGCNKLRITPDGKLRACLADSAFIDLGAILRRPHGTEDLAAAFSRAARAKPLVGPWNSAPEMWRVGG